MSNSNRYPYRPDIDGLRAVAVGAVVAHHLESSLVPGGFIGVDVFFVISGFVVTQSILRTQTGQVFRDLLSFWRRRWLRIIPALLFMVAITSLVFAAFFAPIPLETYNGTLRTGLTSAFGLSNLYLLRLSTDYFQSDQSINVFLHTWSLGVEEQFYVVFSLLIIGASGLVARHDKVKLVRFVLLVLFFIGSLWLFLDLANRKPMSAYYLLPARFWEMGLGSIIAISFKRIEGVTPPRWLLEGAQYFGVAMLVYGLFLSSEPDAQFAIPILLATGATAIFIIAGTVKQPVNGNIVTIFLGLKPLVLIGLLSYSIYLWHWPILVLFRYTIGLGTSFTITSALCLICLLSWFSYQFIEQKWRGSKAPFIKRLVPQFAMAFSLVILVTMLPQLFPSWVYAGAPQAWKTEWRRDHSFAYGDEGKIIASECSLANGSEVPDHLLEKCFSERASIKVPDSNNSDNQWFPLVGKLILVGDSHSFASWPMGSFGRKHGAFAMAAFGHDGCGPFGPAEGKSASCQKYLHDLPEIMRRELNHGDAVLVSFFMPFDLPEPYPLADKLFRELAEVASKVEAEVIIEAPLPRFSRPAYLCTEEWFRLNYDDCQLQRFNYENRRQYLLHWLGVLEKDYKGVFHIWDAADFLCGEECPQFKGEKPIFRDRNHLSYYGAFSLGLDFIQFLETIRKQNGDDSTLVTQ